MANDNQWSRVNRNQNLYDNHPATEPPTIPPHHDKGVERAVQSHQRSVNLGDGSS